LTYIKAFFAFGLQLIYRRRVDINYTTYFLKYQLTKILYVF